AGAAPPGALTLNAVPSQVFRQASDPHPPALLALSAGYVHEPSALATAHACDDDAEMISRPVSVHEILAILRTRDTLGHRARRPPEARFAQIRAMLRPSARHVRVPNVEDILRQPERP